MELNEILTEGHRAAARWTATVTHTGQALGFAPTGRTISLSGTSFLTFRDGKIENGYNHMDFTRVVLELQAASLKTQS